MPAYFVLTRKDNPTGEPVKFATIDEEMCEHFGVTPDPVKYYRGWYDVIGEALAMGASFEKIRECFVTNDEQNGIAIVDFLDANFVSDAWYSRGKS